MKLFIASLAVLFVLGGCGEPEMAVTPVAISLNDDATGHYCGMSVVVHAGPKAQIHLAGRVQPLWFTQVRDAFAYDRMPEESADVAVIYVSDIGAAGATWDDPGRDNWIKAEDAFFVHGSALRGGMGAPELVPFSTRDAAQRFAANNGGSIIIYAEIDDTMVLAPVDVELGGDARSDDGQHMHQTDGS